MSSLQNPLLYSLILLAGLYLIFGGSLVEGQLLPALTRIPSNSNGTRVEISINIYDRECFNQRNNSDAGAGGESSNSSRSRIFDDWVNRMKAPTNDGLTRQRRDTEGQLRRLIRSQSMYTGAVALNSNNTCEVVCHQQTMKQFSVQFEDDQTNTITVLVGRLYLITMPDDTSCDNGNGKCGGGKCGGGKKTTPAPSTSPAPTTSGSTPPATTPAGTTPAGTTPAGTTPAGTTPAGTTPAAATPAATTAGA